MRLNISALWFVEILECLVGALEKGRKWPFSGKKLSPETPISAKNGHFWSKNLPKWTQICPNAEVPLESTIPLIVG